MKTKSKSDSKRVLVIIAALLFVVVFFGCDGDTNSNLNTSQKTEPEPKTWEEQLRQDYLTKLQSEGEYPDLTIDDVWIKKYYGTYDGWAVVMMDAAGMEYEVGVQDIIWGFGYDQRAIIRFTDSNRILIWKDGKFYNYFEKEFPAHDTGFSDYDECNIINIQNGFDGEEWQLMWNDLTYYIYGRSSEDGDILYEDFYIPDLIEKDLKKCFIFQNLGIYDGYMVVSVKAVSGGVTHELPYSLLIGGARFFFLKAARGWYSLLGAVVDEIYIYKDGIFSPLWDAYWDDGLLSSLTPEQFAELAYLHNAGTAWE